MEFHSMEFTIFWAKLIGFFMLITTASQLVRRNKFAEMEKNLYENPGATAVSALLFLLLGLAVILSHNVWEWSLAGIVTVGGWVFTIRGALRLFYPEFDTKIANSIDTNRRNLWLSTATLVGFLLFNLWVLYLAFTI